MLTSLTKKCLQSLTRQDVWCSPHAFAGKSDRGLHDLEERALCHSLSSRWYPSHWVPQQESLHDLRLLFQCRFFDQGGAWWTHREAKGGTLSTYLTSTITTSFSLNLNYIRPTLLFKGDSHVSNKPWEKRGGSRLGKVIFSSNHRESERLCLFEAPISSDTVEKMEAELMNILQ